jgi:hypothetical protein
MEFKKITDNTVCWSTTNIQTCGYFIHCYATILLHDCFNRCNALWCHYSVCLTGLRTVCYRTNANHELLIPLAHLLQWQTCITLLNFHSSLFFFGVCCKRGGCLYPTTAPSCCIPASYCHLSAILQTTSIIPANLQDNWAVFRIFIALLRFSFDSTLYVTHEPTHGTGPHTLLVKLRSSTV